MRIFFIYYDVIMSTKLTDVETNAMRNMINSYNSVVEGKSKDIGKSDVDITDGKVSLDIKDATLKAMITEMVLKMDKGFKVQLAARDVSIKSLENNIISLENELAEVKEERDAMIIRKPGGTAFPLKY